jgi:uncharacterized protein (DUF169 family)
MESKIASILGLQYAPVALLWSDEKPQNAIEFKQGRFGCVMFSFANAARGRTAVFSRETFGCWGGGVGLGFGNRYVDFPGGEECFYYFLSNGNKNHPHGRMVGEHMKNVGMNDFYDDFMEGERYLKGPEQVESLVQNLPIIDIPAQYVILKPLAGVDAAMEQPETITFMANSDQLSALVVLANHGRKGFDNVAIPFVAGCQSIGILTYAQGKSPEPKAAVGLVDLSARKNVRKLLGSNLLSFSMPLSLFREMENNVETSFFFRNTWKALSSQS